MAAECALCRCLEAFEADITERIGTQHIADLFYTHLSCRKHICLGSGYTVVARELNRRRCDSEVDLFGAFLTQEGDDVLGGRTTDDGVVDDNDLFAFYSCLQNGKLEADRHLTGSLCALDKCSSDIAVLKKCLTIRNAAFKSITDRSRDTGVRSRYDKVCIAGVFTGQRTSCLYTGPLSANFLRSFSLVRFSFDFTVGNFILSFSAICGAV